MGQQGLPEVDVLGVTDSDGVSLLVVEVASRGDQGWCRECGVKARLKDITPVTSNDMTRSDRPSWLVWHK